MLRKYGGHVISFLQLLRKSKPKVESSATVKESPVTEVLGAADQTKMATFALPEEIYPQLPDVQETNSDSVWAHFGNTQ